MARNGGQGRGSSRPGFRCSSPRLDSNRLRQKYVVVMAFLAVCLLLSFPALAQNGGGSDDDVHITPRHLPTEPKPMDTIDPALKTHTKPIVKDVDLVLVPVTITDPLNRLVTGLDRQNFAVFEGKDKQEIRHFSSEDAPISLGVIFDMSGSMADKIDKSRQAVVEFFRTANPQDEFFLIAFSDKPEVLVDFTSSVEDIQSRLAFTIPKGRTALLDAIYLGMNRMRRAKYERKALLIVSDGGDNHSRYTEGEIKAMVREADVQIYGIGLFDREGKTAEER